MSNKPKEDKTKNITKISAKPRTEAEKTDLEDEVVTTVNQTEETRKPEVAAEDKTKKTSSEAKKVEAKDSENKPEDEAKDQPEASAEESKAEPAETKPASAKASETKAVATKAKTQPTKADKKATKAAKKKSTDSDEKPLKEVFILARPFVVIGRYLRDSWRELRQVRWTNRKSTWKMTFAVLIYCAIFIVFIVLLDMFFTFIFNLLLGQH